MYWPSYDVSFAEVENMQQARNIPKKKRVLRMVCEELLRNLIDKHPELDGMDDLAMVMNNVAEHPKLPICGFVVSKTNADNLELNQSLT